MGTVGALIGTILGGSSIPLARHKELTPQKLLEHPYISREPGSGTREFTESYLRGAGVSLDQMNVVMELGSPIALNGVVQTGLGFAVASRASVSKEQRLGDIVAIPLKPRLIRTLSMVYPKEKFRSRLVATFVELRIFHPLIAFLVFGFALLAVWTAHRSGSASADVGRYGQAIIILEFPSMENVRAFYDSDEYQKGCKPLREGTGIYDIAFFESPPPASA